MIRGGGKDLGKIGERWWEINVWEVVEEMVRNDIEGKERDEES